MKVNTIKLRDNKCKPKIKDINQNNKDIKEKKENKKTDATRRYKINIFYIKDYLINIFLIKTIFFLLPYNIIGYKYTNNYISIKLNSIGFQHIISDDYNISQFPPRIYINKKITVLRNKKVLINSINDTIRLEWFNTFPNMSYMFANLENIESVNISNMFSDTYPNNISYMFYNCHNLQNLIITGNKNNYLISDATKMFYNCFSLESLDFSKMNSINEVNTSYFCYNCHNLISFTKIGSDILTNDMRFMFYNCYHLTSINLNFLKISSSTNMSYLFSDCNNIINITWDNENDNLNNLSDMRNMFYNCFSINSISFPFSKKNINISMANMFYNCINLRNIEFKTYVYYPNDIHAMFYNCSSLKYLNLENKIITNYVFDMSYLFYNCSLLDTLMINFSNELTINMEGTFSNCRSLTSLNLTAFYTPNVEIMWNMFKGCNGLLNLDLQNFDTSKVTDMESMFEECINLSHLSLEYFDTSKVQYMNKMFKDCTNLRSLNFKNINVTSVGTMNQMFYNCQNLEYLNLYNIDEKEKDQSIYEILTNTPNNFTFCIKEKENIPNIFEILLNKEESIRDCSENCYEKERISILNKKLCCNFVYRDNCYNKCPGKTQIKEISNICEDFTCTNNEYYDYEQNKCITDIKGYYINDTIAKTIDKCHEDCLECKGKWTNTSSKCTVCNNSDLYIYLGNCVKDCELVSNSRRCKCLNKKCELCSEESLEYDLCETCNKDYYPKENDSSNYKGWINCYKDPENYYLDNKIYKPCFPSCKYCSKKGNYENQFCLSCNENNTYAILMNDSINYLYNCYPKCSYYYYFDENNKYQCTEELKCPDNYNKLIYDERRCVNNCNETEYNKYEFRKVCYKSCPLELSYIFNENDYLCGFSCPFEKPFEKINDQICVSNCTIMERLNKLCITNYIGNKSDKVQDKLMADIQEDIINSFDYKYLNENVSIILEEINNTYEILTTNKKEEDISKNKASIINLGQCETTLKNYYSIDINETLYLLKLDAYREGMKNPKVIYFVYYPLNGLKLEQLDLSLCEGDSFSVYFSTNITLDKDLYNKNSGYYNDICYTYTSEDGTDISLEDRKRLYTENNQSLCEEDCEFVDYDYDEKKAECSCKIKSSTSLVSELKIDKNVLYNFVDIKRMVNFDVMKCFYLIFEKNNNNSKKNIGIYIFIPTFIMYFICIIIFIKKDYFLLKMNIEEIIRVKKILRYLNKNKHNYERELIFLNKLKPEKSLSNFLTNKSIKNNYKHRIIESKNKKNKKNKSIQLKIKGDKIREELYENNNPNNRYNNYIQLDPNYFKETNEDNKENNYENNKNKIVKIKLKIKRKIIKRKIKNIIPFHSSSIQELKEDDYIRKNIKKNSKLSKNIKKKNIKREEDEDSCDDEIDVIYKYKVPISKEEKENIKNILKYNNRELNSMDYSETIQKDHRKFVEYYISLLKSEHMIMTIFDNNDYNSRIIKIFLCFYNFASCYTINGFFFDDSTMHKIYEQKGNYNVLSQLPQIMYSTIISSILNGVLYYFALPEKYIIELKQKTGINNFNSIKNKLLIKLYHKFIIFFILSFSLVFLFWYYIVCFCAVYKNTQYHLLKDSITSFIISLVSPLGICLLSSLLRFISLRKENKCNKIIFGLSNLIQIFN